MSRPCFIVSVGRSGSKMLAETLSLHPEVLALHEPRPFLSTENLLTWQGRIPGQRAKREIREKRDWLLLAAKRNGLLYVESSHFISHLVLLLFELYRPRFVFLYRDGREVVRSGVTRRWYTRPDAKTRVARILRRMTLQPFGNPVEDHQLPPPRHARTRFEKAAWLWNEVNTSITSQLASLPQADVLPFRLEDIGPDELGRLLRFLKLDFSERLLDTMIATADSRPNRTEGAFSIPPFEEWDEGQIASFSRLAGPQMRHLGYWTRDRG